MNDDNAWELFLTHTMPAAEVRERLTRHTRSTWLPEVLPAIRTMLIEEGVDPDRAITLSSRLFERGISKYVDELAPKMMAEMQATAPKRR